MPAHQTIESFLRILFEPGDVFEVRAPKCADKKGGNFRSTASGYYSFDNIAQAAMQVGVMDDSERAPGWYVTLNPVRPDLLARAANRINIKADSTTSDGEIVRRNWLLVDLDPVRPAGVSATDAELAVAEQRAKQVAAYLQGKGWSDPVVAMSGNGYHLLYRVNLLPDDGDLCRRTLVAIAEKFDDGQVRVDRGVYNPARISKIIGTVARKGDNLAGIAGVEDRPHRVSQLVRVPEFVEYTPRELVELVGGAADAEPREAKPCPQSGWDSSPEGVRSWLEARGVDVKGSKSKGDVTHLYLARCAVDASIESTGASDISVIVSNSGVISYANQHSRGRHYRWADVRAALDGGTKHRPELDRVDISEFILGAIGKREIVMPKIRDETIDGGVPDPGPFPKHLLAVPGFVGDVMRFNLQTAHRPQPLLALAAALALQATLAARKVKDERGNRTNIYCVGVAKSGAGKEHSRQTNRRILAAAGASELEAPEEVASDSGVINNIEPRPGCVFQIDEFGRFLRTVANPKQAPHLYNIVGVLLKLYSAAGTAFRGKAYADVDKAKVIEQPCVCLYGTTVPEHFYESLTVDSLRDGFVGRLLVFESSEVPPREWRKEQDVPPWIVDTAQYWVSLGRQSIVGDVMPSPRVVEYDDGARDRFDALAAIADKEVAGGDSGIGSVWARAEEKACRLALVYACSLAPESPRITLDVANWACELSEYLTKRLLYVASQWVSENTHDARGKRVIRIITDSGGSLDKTAITRRTPWLTGRERNELLADLCESGRLAINSEIPERGRARTVYQIPNKK